MLFTLIFASLYLAPSPALAAVDWNALLNQDSGSKVRFGVGLDGRDPFRRNFDELFAPASTAKLFTAGAALALLGEDYRYPTVIRWQESEPGMAAGLRLIGSGDPSFGLSEIGENNRSRFDLIARKLKESGVRTVVGEISVGATDPRWNSFSIPEGWKDSDPLSCGGALAFGFNFNGNCATYKLNSAADGAWTTAGASFPVELRVSNGSANNFSVKLVHGTGGARYQISGTWKSGSHSFTMPIFDTRTWAKNLFRQALAAQGIQFKASTGGGDPGREDREFVFHSLPLKELLKPFLKNSINFMGDAVLKTVGASGGPGGAGDLLQPGLSALLDYLYRLGLPRTFELHDGSGLSRTAKCSPRGLLEFLTAVKREKYFPALWNALAVAGVDGTLRNRMKGTSAASRLHAKTGTLDGVYNLAGYVRSGDDYVPFAALTRTTGSLSAAARAAEDRLGVQLAKLHPSADHFVSYTIPSDPYPYVPEHAGFDDQ